MQTRHCIEPLDEEAARTIVRLGRAGRLTQLLVFKKRGLTQGALGSVSQALRRIIQRPRWSKGQIALIYR